MSLRDRLATRAIRLGESTAEAVVVHSQQASTRYRGMRAVLEEDGEAISMEDVLAGLVRAVRADEHEEDRSARDVYESARSRRRRLGLLSFGAGPLVGVATHIVELYCEMAIVCDLAELHSISLSDDELAAHMLVLWDVVDTFDRAVEVMAETAPCSLAEIIGLQVRKGALEHLPHRLSRKAAVQALADARRLLGDTPSRTASLGGVVFSGHRTKQLIKKAELQLCVR
jgi:hypothetical protein